eukprot:Lankesteria_metandrocarpae@DN2172_c0_g1_i1.p1
MNSNNGGTRLSWARRSIGLLAVVMMILGSTPAVAPNDGIDVAEYVDTLVQTYRDVIPYRTYEQLTETINLHTDFKQEPRLPPDAILLIISLMRKRVSIVPRQSPRRQHMTPVAKTRRFPGKLAAEAIVDSLDPILDNVDDFIISDDEIINELRAIATAENVQFVGEEFVRLVMGKVRRTLEKELPRPRIRLNALASSSFYKNEDGSLRVDNSDTGYPFTDIDVLLECLTVDSRLRNSWELGLNALTEQSALNPPLYRAVTLKSYTTLERLSDSIEDSSFKAWTIEDFTVRADAPQKPHRQWTGSSTASLYGSNAVVPPAVHRIIRSPDATVNLKVTEIYYDKLFRRVLLLGLTDEKTGINYAVIFVRVHGCGQVGDFTKEDIENLAFDDEYGALYPRGVRVQFRKGVPYLLPLE